jgi:hypothetical protein
MRIRPSLGWMPWMLGTILGVVLAILLLRPMREESFQRLYERIVAAGQSGDQATVVRLMPLALQAFRRLDPKTPDARYHLAMLELHVGDLAAARAQADTIQREAPEHLFGWVVQAAVARWSRDPAGQAEAWRHFLERWEPELRLDRPEYREHRATLEEVRRAATTS